MSNSYGYDVMAWSITYKVLFDLVLPHMFMSWSGDYGPVVDFELFIPSHQIDPRFNILLVIF